MVLRFLKLAWVNRAFILSFFALIISGYTLRETRLTRQQGGARPQIIERFDYARHYSGFSPNFFVYQCRSVLQIKNQGATDTSITNVNINTSFKNTAGVWFNDIMRSDFDSTISQPLGFDFIEYIPNNTSAGFVLGYQLLVVGLENEETLDSFIGQVISDLEQRRQRLLESEESLDNPDRSAVEGYSLKLLRANSYTESPSVPSALNTLPYVIPAGEIRSFPLDVVFVMLDSKNLISERYPVSLLNYNIVFDSNFSERHSTDCQGSNRLPSI